MSDQIPSPGAGGGWREERTEDGSLTLRHAGLDEACHSRSGAWTEARERYVVPCALRERALDPGRGVLRLLDVGTGLALNLTAALAALEGTGTELEVVTLESDAEVLRTGLDLDHGRALGASGERALGILRRALAEALDGSAAGPGADAPRVSLGQGRGSLCLLLGDARRTLPWLGAGPRFDAVFLDPFSPARAPELWGAGFLREVARRMAPGSWLSTYSAAVRVRRAMLQAGLRVGRGPRVGRKAEGTLASPGLDPPPLPERLAAKLARQRDARSGGA